MIYYLRESLFSIRNRFVVKDEFSRDAFLVEGRFFSFKKKLDLYDLRGNDKIKISERLFSFLPKYDIYLNGRKYGQVNKRWSLFRPKLRINSQMGNLNISGDIFAHNFSISLRKNHSQGK